MFLYIWHVIKSYISYASSSLRRSILNVSTGCEMSHLHVCKDRYRETTSTGKRRHSALLFFLVTEGAYRRAKSPFKAVKSCMLENDQTFYCGRFSHRTHESTFDRTQVDNDYEVESSSVSNGYICVYDSFFARVHVLWWSPRA